MKVISRALSCDTSIKTPLLFKKLLLIKKLLMLFTVLFLFAAKGFAENEFSFRIAPRYSAALNTGYFNSGFGASAVLDWQFFSFLPAGAFGRYMGVGACAAGGFGNMSVSDNSNMTLIEGGAGLFYQWRLFDRFTARLELCGGVYNYQWKEMKNTKLFFNSGLGACFHLFPYLAFFANGSYTGYAFSDKGPINTINACVGISLNLGEIMRPAVRVQAQRISQGRIFPVSFSWYSQNEFAVVRITNNEPNAITGINASFFLEQFMNDSSVFAKLPRLGPGESADIPVTALFNESLLYLSDNISANTLITIDYLSLGSKKTLQFPLKMMIFHRNSISWDDDRRAAAFVSPRDSAAELFAKYTAQAARRYASLNPAAASAIPEKVMMAAALLNTFMLYGINYIIDPASSYVELVADASAIDRINYPYQTLNFRGGDCSDLSILYCSVLEALGIETAFITTPGHIYTAFAVDSDSWKHGNADIIEYQGKRWMPVEVTISHKGFAEAWRTGAWQWRTAGEKASLYPLKECWAIYAPVTVPQSSDFLPEMPSDQAIIQTLQSELVKLR